MYKRRRGAALIEFSLVMPIYIMALFCFLQLSLIITARLMMTYGAFSAARAGIVYNAREAEMKKSLLTVLSPFFGRVQNGDDAIDAAYNTIEEEWDDGELSIDIIAPADARNQLRGAVTLKDVFNENDRFLHVRVNWNFPMVIPLANRIFQAFVEGQNWVQSTSATEPGVFLGAPAGTGTDPRIPLFADYDLRLTGIYQQ